MQWPFDTTPDRNYPLYTRGNVGEVFPTVVTPLTHTLTMSRGMQQSWYRTWTTDAPILDEGVDPAVVLGVFGGYAYLNLSVIRRAADLSPGTSPEEIDHQFFAIGVTLPPYERPDEPGYEERAEKVAEWVEAVLGDPPYAGVAADREMAFAIRKQNTRRRRKASDRALLLDMIDMAERLVVLFRDHLVVSGLSSVAFAMLQLPLRELFGDRGDDLARRALSALGGVDSAEPAAAIAQLATLDGDAYKRAFRKFLRDYGFRGVNEWELASPSWELVPDEVEALVAKAKGSEPKVSPEQTRVDAVAEIAAKWPEYRNALEVASFFVGGRERTKTYCVVLVNEARLDAHELARRLVKRKVLKRADQVFMLTMDELSEACRTGNVPADLASRETAFAELSSRMPPLVVDAAVPPVDTWPTWADAAMQALAAGQGVTEIRGIAGSPGTAVGRARVVIDPHRSTPPSPGEILVAPITDPGWTPMFVPASAVVVEVGGELSHAVIVARELGIPAVVAAAGCTTALRDGDLIEVDGSTGVVRVLERA